MSEQIEIEVGLNTQRFQQAIQGVHKSVQSLSSKTGRIKITGLTDGLERVKKVSEENNRKALTLAGAFRELGNIKVSNKSLNDIKEITREFLRIVKELGPVITLAMNALDRPLQKAVLSMTRMLTEVERANSNFLVLRKVLPIRLFNTLSVNAERISTSVKGMAKDFKDFGNGTASAVSTSIETLKKLTSQLKKAGVESKKFGDNLTGGGFTKVAQDLGNVGKGMKLYSQAMTKAVTQTKIGNKLFQATGSSLAVAQKGFSSVASTLGKFTGTSSRAYTSLVNLAKGSTVLSRSLNILTKGAVGLGIVAFRGLTASVTMLGSAFARLASTGVSKAIPAISKTANIATRSVKALSQSILSIATAPIRAVSGAFGGLIKTIGGSIGMITSVVGAIGTLGYALGNVAQGAVATFRKNWIKVLSEVPNASAKATDDMKADLKNLQSEVGILSKDALPSLQKALQLGFTTGNAIDLLRQSSSLAVAEITDLENAVGLVGNSMKVFASSNITAEQAVDKLYTASKQGGVNLEELGSAVQRVAPNISKTGVSFDEFTSSLAVLVRSGRLTYSALQDIANITGAIATPSEKAQAMFKKLGVEFGKNALQGKGLSGVLVDIVNATDGNATAIMQMLGGQENLNTAMRLGANSGQDFANALTAVEGSAGNAKGQADAIDTSFSRALRRARVTAEALMVSLGEIMSPAIKSVNEFILEYTAKIKRAVQIGMEIFKAGDFGEFLKLSFQVGIGKAEVMFVNFTQKAGEGLFAGLSEAMAQIAKAVPILATAFGAVWDKMKSAGFSAIGHMVEALGTMVSVWSALFFKAIDEIREKWSDFTGGSYKARDLKTIVEQEMDNSTIRELGQKFQLMGKEATSAGEVSAKQIYDTLVPAVKAVGEATATAFKSTSNIATDSEKTVEAQKKLTALIDKAKKALDEANKKTQEETGSTAVSSDLPVNEGGEGGVGGVGGGIASIGQVIASGLAQVGGGGNVQQTQVSLLSELTRTARDQLNEIKIQTRALEDRELGVVQ